MFLLISDQKPLFLQVACRLSEHGLFLFYSPFETAAFLCEQKDVGGVVIDCAEQSERGACLCRELRASYPEMPIAVIANGSPSALDADWIIRCQPTPEALAERLMPFFEEACGWSQQNLSTYYLTVDCKGTHATYMGYPLPLTPRQHRILYCLFYHATKPISPDDLLAITNPMRSCSLATLNRHIRRINRNAAEIAPHAPPLLQYSHMGYQLSAAVLSRSKKE